MQPRTTAILLALAAALGAFVYFYEIGGELERREALEREGRLFPGLDEAEIQVITLASREGGELRLERVAEGWRIREPLDFPADRAQTDALASSLASLSSDGAFAEPAGLSEYGLTGDLASRVGFEAGGSRYELALGDETPQAGQRYLELEGGVHRVPSFEVSAFDKSLDDFRDRKILDFDTASILQVDLGWPGGGLLLTRNPEEEKNAGSGWRIVTPVDARADERAVEALLSDLSFLRAEGFVDEPDSDDLEGFMAPALWLTLSAGESMPPSSLAVSGEELEGQRLVRTKGPGLYSISAERFDALPRELFAYRHKRLSHFPAFEADQLEFYFDNPAGDPVVITARREASGWSSIPEAMDSEDIQRALSELSNLEASAIIAESVGEAELAALGLAPPRAILTVFSEREGDDGADAAAEASLVKLAELRVGALDAEKGLLAQVAGDPVLYRIPVEATEFLPASLEAFRNRFAGAGSAPERLPLDDGVVTDFLPSAEESP